MNSQPFTLDDLQRILLAAAGAAETGSIDASNADVQFTDLGYDSIAMLETAAQIERELEMQLEDDVVAEAKTPALLLAAVNGRLAEKAAA